MRVMKLQRKTEGRWQRKEKLFLIEGEEISLITDQGKMLIEKDLERGKGGFCHRRFKANILLKIEGNEKGRKMHIRDQLLGEEVILGIKSVGKTCHENCPIYTKEGCSFLKDIYFLMVHSPGKITLMEELKYKNGLKNFQGKNH